MHRCLQLATLASGQVAPNPMVGAVLVHDDRIIGEGYHMAFGQPHAEVNCLNAVSNDDKHLISKSTLYVSLEPCAHHGKTPPCADLIIINKIPKVVIGCRDPFTEVNGRGIEKLTAAGVEVTEGVLKNKCTSLNKRFLTFHTQHRPYIILKWAQSMDHRIAGPGSERIAITNHFTNIRVHQWRGEEASILVGTTTALIDNPSLTTRLWKGNNPIRMVIDKNLRLPASLHLFDRRVKTIVFNNSLDQATDNLVYVKVHKTSFPESIIGYLFRENILSVFIEGGSKLLQSFINIGLWDEARVITNKDLMIGEGVVAPDLGPCRLVNQEDIYNDLIHYYYK